MNKTKTVVIFFLLLSAAIAVHAQQVVEAIVAVVNDEFISLSDYMTRHDRFYRMMRDQLQGEEFNKQYEAFKGRLMDDMITEILLLQEARNKGLDATEQLNVQVEQIKQDNGIESDAQLRQLLRQENINYDEWIENLRVQILQQYVLGAEVGRNIVVDDSELIGTYNTNLEDFREPEEYTLKGLYISSEGKTEEDVQAKTQEIDEKIAAGEDFSSLATQFGEGPEKEAQGDLGSFVKGQMLPNMEEAVEVLDIGELSSWIEMPNGWYLLRLEDKKESRVKPFEEVREEIETRLFSEKNENGIREYLEDLKNRSYIKILIPDPLEYR